MIIATITLSVYLDVATNKNVHTLQCAIKNVYQIVTVEVQALVARKDTVPTN